MKKSNQISSANFLGVYGGLDMYDKDVKKIYTIDHEEIQFFKKKVWAIIGLTDGTDGIYTDHESFSIHEYLFDINMATHQNEVIPLKIIAKYIYLLNNKESQNKQSNKSNKTNYIMEPCHTHQRKRHKL